MPKLSIIRVLVCGALFSCIGCCDAAGAAAAAAGAAAGAAAAAKPTIATELELDTYCREHYLELVHPASLPEVRHLATSSWLNEVLYKALVYDYAPAFTWFLDAGGDPNRVGGPCMATYENCPLLVIAAAFGAVEVTLAMLTHPRTKLQVPSNYEYPDYNGNLLDALLAAIRGCHPDCARLILLKAKELPAANLDIRDRSGKLPAAYLVDCHYTNDIVKQALITDLQRLNELTNDWDTKQKITFCIGSLGYDNTGNGYIRKDIRATQIRKWLKGVKKPADLVSRLFEGFTAAIVPQSLEWVHALWHFTPTEFFLPGGYAAIIYKQPATNAQKQTLEVLQSNRMQITGDVFQRIKNTSNAICDVTHQYIEHGNARPIRCKTGEVYAEAARNTIEANDDVKYIRMLQYRCTRKVLLQQKGAWKMLFRLGGIGALCLGTIAGASYIGCRIANPFLSIIPTFLASLLVFDSSCYGQARLVRSCRHWASRRLRNLYNDTLRFFGVF
jgi:hypothetical protein